MAEIRFLVTQELYVRRIALVAREAVGYASHITFELKNKKGNATSIFDLLRLGMQVGDEIVIHAEGEDESIAVSQIQATLHSFEKTG